MADPVLTPSRRHLFKTLAALGVGTTVFQRAVAAQAPKAGAVTAEMIQQAEWIAGIKLTDDERQAARRLASTQPAASSTGSARSPLGQRRPAGASRSPPAPPRRPPRDRPPNVGPSSVGRPEEARTRPTTSRSCRSPRSRRSSASDEVSSVELTKLYLDRLKKYDPALKCVVTLTEDLALKQAAAGGQGDRGRASTAGRCTASRGGRRT